jgi:hopanoid biosynthesis associated protein HpnK
VRRDVIVNADDFGLSPGVNRGIVEAFRGGVLTSTTMLTNARFVGEAVSLARAHPDLPVGIHLTLLWGAPLSDRADVPSLLDRDGHLPRSLGTLARRYFTGRLSLGEVRRELAAQIRAFLDTGLHPTHVDTHKHVHALPGVLDAVIAAASEFGIERVRVPAERGLDPAGDAAPPASRSGRVKRDLLRFLCRGARKTVHSAGLRTTDHFLGIEHMACLNSATLHFILGHLREGVTELMCHPGYVDGPLLEYSAIPPHREQELRALTDPAVRRRALECGVRFLHYGEL